MADLNVMFSFPYLRAISFQILFVHLMRHTIYIYSSSHSRAGADLGILRGRGGSGSEFFEGGGG